MRHLRAIAARQNSWHGKICGANFYMNFKLALSMLFFFFAPLAMGPSLNFTARGPDI